MTDALELCAQRFKNHGIKLISPEITPSLSVECRNHEIVQVLVNLLNNSFDAVSTLDEKWVELTVREIDATVEFAR